MSYSTQGSRDALTYADANSVRFYGKQALMGGFRFRGRQTRAIGPVFPMPADPIASVTAAGLGAETAPKAHNWYAAFACANDGASAAVLKTMPFLRIGDVQPPSSGFQNVYLFQYAGEGGGSSAITYQLPQNRLANTDCLVISANGEWSGKIARIIGNSSNHIELNLAGLRRGDWLLPAPPGFTHYAYLGSFYFEGEVRNIYDSGTIVKAKMINMVTPMTAGSVSTPTRLYCDGFISPLATAVILDSFGNFSTGDVGEFAEYYDADGGMHVVQTARYRKTITTSDSYAFDNIQVPFLRFQSFWYSNAGPLAGHRSGGNLQVTGWIEP